MYVATVDLPFTVPKMSYPLGTPDGNGTGEIVALNLATGHVEWDTKVPAVPAGGSTVFGAKGGSPQVVTYTVP